MEGREHKQCGGNERCREVGGYENGGEGKCRTQQVGPGAAKVALASGRFNLEVTDTAVADITGLVRQDPSIAALGAWLDADDIKSKDFGDAKDMGKAWVHSDPDADTGADMHEDGETVAAIDMEARRSLPCSDPTDGAGCTAQKASEGRTLGERWTFTPKSGARWSMKDGMCIFFGWRLRDDAKGPTHAGAFYGVVPASGETGALSATDGFNLSGGATYKRMAAGKFAIDNSLGSDSYAGHFTGDSMLIAWFGATTDANSNGLTGTIEGFQLNDGRVQQGWSVSLKTARWNGTDSVDGLMANTGTDTADDTAIDGAANEWSIVGTASLGRTGQW